MGAGEWGGLGAGAPGGGGRGGAGPGRQAPPGRDGGWGGRRARPGGGTPGAGRGGARNGGPGAAGNHRPPPPGVPHLRPPRPADAAWPTRVDPRWMVTRSASASPTSPPRPRGCGVASPRGPPLDGDPTSVPHLRPLRPADAAWPPRVDSRWTVTRPASDQRLLRPAYCSVASPRGLVLDGDPTSVRSAPVPPGILQCGLPAWTPAGW